MATALFFPKFLHFRSPNLQLCLQDRGLCFDFPSCILSKMKKGFNASAKFPAVKEKSAAFTGSCLGGKLPRPSRAHPAVGQGPPAPALFVCGHFCHFPVHSCLRDMGPAQPNKALSHPKKLRTRAASASFFSKPGGRQAAAPKPRTSRCGTGPLLRPRFSFAAIFVISWSAAACATWGRRSQTRRFPIPKSQERGLLRVRFSRVRRAASCRAQAAHILLRDRAPPAPALFAGSYFLPIAACASCPGAAGCIFWEFVV